MDASFCMKALAAYERRHAELTAGPCAAQVQMVHSFRAGVAELADARDLKSRVLKGTCGFDSRPRHLASRCEAARR